jgi:hypothetical protein
MHGLVMALVDLAWDAALLGGVPVPSFDLEMMRGKSIGVRGAYICNIFSSK